MVKNGTRRKDVGEERIVAVESDADVLRRLGVGRVCNYKVGRVGPLTADQ